MLSSMAIVFGRRRRLTRADITLLVAPWPPADSACKEFASVVKRVRKTSFTAGERDLRGGASVSQRRRLFRKASTRSHD
jgi:hypothetical protein